MDKYHVHNFLINIFIHNKLLICSRMADWGTRDPRLGSGLYHLGGSHIVLIRLAVLGHFMMRAKHWARAGTGPIE